MFSGHLACACACSCAWADEPGGRWCTDGPPVTVHIWWLELENLCHTGSLCSWNSALGCRLWVQTPGCGSSYTSLHNTEWQHVEIEWCTIFHLAHGLMHMHMLHARWAYHCTDPSGMGLKWSQYCGPFVTVYIRWLELENLGNTDGLRSWNSALGCRLRVQASGRGSFLQLPLSSCVVRKAYMLDLYSYKVLRIYDVEKCFAVLKARYGPVTKYANIPLPLHFSFTRHQWRR